MSDATDGIDDFGEIQDLTPYEQQAQPLGARGGTEVLSPVLPAPAPSNRSGILRKSAAGLASAIFAVTTGMFLAGYRIWGIAPPDMHFDIPFHSPGSGGAHVCYLYGSADELLVNGRTGAQSIEPPEPVELEKNVLFFAGACRDVVPLDGNAHIRLFFPDQASSGWGLYKRE